MVKLINDKQVAKEDFSDLPDISTAVLGRPLPEPLRKIRQLCGDIVATTWGLENLELPTSKIHQRAVLLRASATRLEHTLTTVDPDSDGIVRIYANSRDLEDRFKQFKCDVALEIGRNPAFKITLQQSAGSPCSPATIETSLASAEASWKTGSDVIIKFLWADSSERFRENSVNITLRRCLLKEGYHSVLSIQEYWRHQEINAPVMPIILRFSSRDFMWAHYHEDNSIEINASRNFTNAKEAFDTLRSLMDLVIKLKRKHIAGTGKIDPRINARLQRLVAESGGSFSDCFENEKAY